MRKRTLKQYTNGGEFFYKISLGDFHVAKNVLVVLTELYGEKATVKTIRYIVTEIYKDNNKYEAILPLIEDVRNITWASEEDIETYCRKFLVKNEYGLITNNNALILAEFDGEAYNDCGDEDEYYTTFLEQLKNK